MTYPRKRSSAINASSAEMEAIQMLAPLACQPAGEIHLFDVIPQSAQSSNKETYKTQSQELKSKLSEVLAPLLEVFKEHEENGIVAGFQMKVLFIIGKNEREKDLDNMLKWFLDCLKSSIKMDDSLISDLRAFKFRCNHHDIGKIGFSVATQRYDRGDWMRASVLLALQAQKSKEKSQSVLLDAVKIVQEQINEIINPQFQ